MYILEQMCLLLMLQFQFSYNHEGIVCNGMVSFFSVDGLKEFATQFLNGELTPYVKSEPVPASNDGPVKVELCTSVLC